MNKPHKCRALKHRFFKEDYCIFTNKPCEYTDYHDCKKYQLYVKMAGHIRKELVRETRDMKR